MLIRTMDQLEAEGRVISISHGKASAVRLLTKSDGVGFSVSEARAHGHGSSDLWYKHHWDRAASVPAAVESSERSLRCPLRSNLPGRAHFAGHLGHREERGVGCRRRSPGGRGSYRSLPGRVRPGRGRIE